MSPPKTEFSIVQEIESSKGWAIKRRLDKVTLAYRIFIGNAEDLDWVLSIAEDPTKAANMMSENNKNEFNRFMEHVLRYLHNYAASAKTLVEHSRPVFREVFPKPLWETYTKRVNVDFASNNHSRFVQQLRDYTLHWRSPQINLSLSFGQNVDEISRLSIDCKTLLEWKKWNAESKAYIRSVEPTVCLHKCIREYTQKVTNFIKWIEEALDTQFASEYKELHDLQKSLYESIKASGTPIPDHIKQQFT